MDFLILPISHENCERISDCTCFMGAANSDKCIGFVPICHTNCTADCTVLVCGRGVARRITM